MKIRIVIIIGIVLITTSTGIAETLYGVILNQHNTPIPGLTVSMVHPSVGRSFPSITDPLGRYFFNNVPLINSPFYLEVYWRYQMLYRNTIMIRGNVQLPPIILQQ